MRKIDKVAIGALGVAGIGMIGTIVLSKDVFKTTEEIKKNKKILERTEELDKKKDELNKRIDKLGECLIYGIGTVFIGVGVLAGLSIADNIVEDDKLDWSYLLATNNLQNMKRLDRLEDYVGIYDDDDDYDESKLRPWNG